VTDPTQPPALPFVPLPDPSRLPAELRNSTAWILWRAEWKRERAGWKLSKVPCDAGGKTCSMTDPNARAPLAQVLGWARRARESLGTRFGVGLTFCAVEGFFALDLDGDLSDGTSPRIEWLTGQFPTWAETSVSGRGAHLFYGGTFTGKRKFPWRGSSLEVFGTTGFVAVTGNALTDCPAELSDGSALLTTILTEAAAAGPSGPQPRQNGHASGDDAELLYRMLKSKAGPKIRTLWDGGGTDDQSTGDLALCGYLAFWVGGPDDAAIDQLFRQSGRMRDKWDEPHSHAGSTYGEMTIRKALTGRTEFYKPRGRRKSAQSANGKHDAPTKAGPAGEGPVTGTRIILDYFRETYRPLFRRGNCIYAGDGREVRQAEATSTPTTKLIDRLATASDAPKVEGGVKRSALPKFFSTWSKPAWGDLLESLPTEDDAVLGTDGPARDEFRRLVAAAMVTEVVLGTVVRGKGNDHEVTEVERRPLIDWCVRFAHPGPWRDIRGKRCYTKLFELDGGEVRVAIAIRHELLAQLRADRRLTEMGPKAFARRCAAYGVGTTTRADRPHGQSAVVFDPEFVSELTSSLPDEVPHPSTGMDGGIAPAQ
jgi:putative DNA primase/helicase